MSSRRLVPCTLTLCLMLAWEVVDAGVLTHRYSFNDGTARDSAGHADGVVKGGVTIDGGQAHFDGGEGERIELPANGPNGINVNGYRAITLEAWFSRHGGGGFQRLFDFGRVAGMDNGTRGSQYVYFSPYTRYLGTAGGHASRVALNDTDDPAAEARAFTGASSADVETHAAVVIDDQTVTLYIDGEEVSQAPLGKRTLSGLSNEQALLGGALFSADPSFSGSIDEFRIYDVAASADQIAASYRAGPDTVSIDRTPEVHATVPQPTLKIDVARARGTVSPLHAGLMTEEINHSYDGGLYGELIRNRALQDEYDREADREWSAPPPHWAAIPSSATLRNDLGVPFTAELPSSLRIDARTAGPGHRVGAANDGFWGIPVRPHTSYQYSFYAKEAPGFRGPLTVALESPDGATTYATAKIFLRSEGWQQYAGTVTTDAEAPVTAKGRWVISTETPGTFWINLVSLFPPTFNHRQNGNRIDLMQRLAALHPAFLRFPGGNYLEGDSIANRFDWKKTLGPLQHRPTHLGYWSYHSSDGMGLYEFLLWCEELHMEPVLGVYAGNSVGRNASFVKPGPDLQPYVQDALDEIEYITGDASSLWGRRRAEAGHPEPFKLTYVEIGNEDWNPASEYDGRFKQFYDAIKAKYPHLQLIATADVQSRTPDVQDDHYYRKAEDFYKDVHHYDHADRKGPKVFVGEWATTEGNPTPTFNAALGDAAWMTGMERNADIVVMQAYAPLLVNVNTPPELRWATNLIGYDALASFGSPSYYAQVVFNANRGDEILESSNIASGIYSSVTRDSRRGTLYIKVVNTRDVDQSVKVDIHGVRSVNSKGTLIVVTGHPEDVNSLSQPEKVHPIQSELGALSKQFQHIFPGRSISVLRISAR